MNWELPDVQAGFRKSKGTRDQIVNICWIIDKAREFQKNIYFCFIDYVNCGKFLKTWEYQTTLLVSWEIFMQVKKQQLEPYIFLGSEITADSDCSHEIKRHLLLGRKAMANLEREL